MQQQNDALAQRAALDNLDNLAMIPSRTIVGVGAAQVIVEVHLSNGLPSFNLVGLAETAVRESKERVRAAIESSGFEFPARRITVNLSPADLPKSGSQFDLPIAIGILAASQQIRLARANRLEMIGELALNGQLHRVRGALPCVWSSTQQNNSIIVPQANVIEAALVTNAETYAAFSLLDVCRHVSRAIELPRVVPIEEPDQIAYPVDLSEVVGQEQAKRALQIAAAGQHNMLMIGPPGAGKSMLAQRMPSILPPFSLDEAIESASIRSITNLDVKPKHWRMRPFRSPHHSSSSVALIGGGSHPRPGEVSQAHGGVLFLDELTEFARHTLEQLREPLETGFVDIARASQSVRFPAAFQLLAACNPCRCGYHGDGTHRCQCTAASLVQYQSRLSGPLMDRIDLHVRLSAVSLSDLSRTRTTNPNVASNLSESAQVRKSVEQARARQLKRQGCLNARLDVKRVDTFLDLSSEDAEFLLNACNKIKLSARGYTRVKKLALTIADLAGAQAVKQAHLAEALMYRTP